MKISKEKFEELVSAYLDNEATPEEKIALSKCIMQDREMARIFYRECKIYAATCKIYGREPSLQKLDGIPNPLNPVKKKSDFNAHAEWAAAAVLASAAMLLVCAAFQWHAPARFVKDNRSHSAARDVKLKSNYFTGKTGIGIAPDSSAIGILEFKR